MWEEGKESHMKAYFRIIVEKLSKDKNYPPLGWALDIIELSIMVR